MLSMLSMLSMSSMHHIVPQYSTSDLTPAGPGAKQLAPATARKARCRAEAGPLKPALSAPQVQTHRLEARVSWPQEWNNNRQQTSTDNLRARMECLNRRMFLWFLLFYSVVCQKTQFEIRIRLSLSKAHHLFLGHGGIVTTSAAMGHA